MNPIEQPGTVAAHRQEIDRLLERFEDAWQNGPPALESYVGSDHSQRVELLKELIKIDLDHRWRNASPVAQRTRIEDYLKKWPELARSAATVLELIREEYWARCCWGISANHAEYFTRFPQHKGDLPRILALVDAELASELAASPVPQGIATAPSRPVPAPLISPAISVGALVDLLRRHHLLTPEQLDELSRTPQAFPSESKALTKTLLQRGWLTPYQANQLVPGNVGELVLGSYILLERLGAGGTGQVFKARHQRLDRVVALKLIRRELLTEPEVVARFYREMQLVSQLDHPNVIHAYDAGPAGETHFLAMEFVEGIDLGKLVKQGGAIPVMQACEYIRQAALGLQHIHERGLVHRDIKPHNLIVSRREGLVKLADLGLARLPHGVNGEVTAAITAAQSTGTLTPENAMLIGTADYLAPEQALDFHNADIRADIYSLGCTLYFLLAGQPPFAGGNLAQKVTNHLHSKPPDIGQFRKDVPPALVDVLGRMLAKRPEERFQTPAELVKPLEALMAGRRWRSRRNWLPLRTRRSRIFAALAGVLVVGLAISRFSVWRSAITPKDGRQEEIQELERRAAGPPVGLGVLRRDLLRFKMRFAGSPEAVQAAELLRQVPSPLDELDSKNIPTAERFAHQPKEVVAVLGEHRWRNWGAVRCAAVSSDGKLLATGGDDWLVRVWDVETKTLRFTFPGHTASVRGLAFTASDRDERYLISAGMDGTLKVWDVARGWHHTSVVAHKEGARAVAIAPNGRVLASAGEDNTVKLWNIDAKLAIVPRPTILKGHHGAVTAVAFHPGSKILASASEDHLVKLWDVDAGKESTNLPGHSGSVNAVVFAPDGQFLVTGSAADKLGEVKVWETVPPRERTAFKVKTSTPVHALALAPDGKTVAVSGSVNPELDVRFIDTATGKEGEPFVNKRHWPVTALAYLPGTRSLLMVRWPGLTVWDTVAKKEAVFVEERGSEVVTVAFSPDCKTLITGGGWKHDLKTWTAELKVWDATTGKHLRSLKGHRNPIQSLAFSPDGAMLASADLEGIVKVWDPASGQERSTFQVYVPGGHRSVFSLKLAFSTNGKVLVTGDNRSTVEPSKLKCWDPETGTELHTLPGHSQGIACLTYSPDAMTLTTGSVDQSIKLWDLASLKERATLPGRHSEVSNLTYSPDGRTLALTTYYGVTLWDVGKEKERTRIPTKARSVVFLHGKWPTSVSSDGRVTVWDDPSGEKNQELKLFGSNHAADLAGDGRHLAVANSNGTVYILDLSMLVPKR
ncbi:MAG: serine/threonine protein kinase [Gemmataceae bacterium]|nr:serine/threonine protein kinase [Gemmataceae bacterium]